jgi:hypothetical protein
MMQQGLCRSGGYKEALRARIRALHTTQLTLTKTSEPSTTWRGAAFLKVEACDGLGGWALSEAVKAWVLLMCLCICSIDDSSVFGDEEQYFLR